MLCMLNSSCKRRETPISPVAYHRYYHHKYQPVAYYSIPHPITHAQKHKATQQTFSHTSGFFPHNTKARVLL
jgi:hypothetical protein